jgi:predicted HTH transcriptional regulator
VVERVKLEGNLATIYESALRFVTRYTDLWDSRPAPPRLSSEETAAPVVPRANYDRNAVSEALVNALAHRDLALREPLTRLKVFDNSIEIINPRRTHGFAPVALKLIRYGVPQTLNPQLAAMFCSPAYGLKLPRGGLPMLLRQSRAFSRRRSEIIAFNDEFRLRLHGG